MPKPRTNIRQLQAKKLSGIKSLTAKALPSKPIQQAKTLAQKTLSGTQQAYKTRIEVAQQKAQEIKDLKSKGYFLDPNDLINNENYIVTRRPDGTIEKIQSKNVQYTHNKNRPDLVNSFSPTIYLFDTKGKPISKLTYGLSKDRKWTNVEHLGTTTYDKDGWATNIKQSKVVKGDRVKDTKNLILNKGNVVSGTIRDVANDGVRSVTNIRDGASTTRELSHGTEKRTAEQALLIRELGFTAQYLPEYKQSKIPTNLAQLKKDWAKKPTYEGSQGKKYSQEQINEILRQDRINRSKINVSTKYIKPDGTKVYGRTDTKTETPEGSTTIYTDKAPIARNITQKGQAQRTIDYEREKQRQVMQAIYESAGYKPISVDPYMSIREDWKQDIATQYQAPEQKPRQQSIVEIPTEGTEWSKTGTGQWKQTTKPIITKESTQTDILQAPIGTMFYDSNGNRISREDAIKIKQIELLQDQYYQTEQGKKELARQQRTEKAQKWIDKILSKSEKSQLLKSNIFLRTSNKAGQKTAKTVIGFVGDEVGDYVYAGHDLGSNIASYAKGQNWPGKQVYESAELMQQEGLPTWKQATLTGTTLLKDPFGSKDYAKAEAIQRKIRKLQTGEAVSKQQIATEVALTALKAIPLGLTYKYAGEATEYALKKSLTATLKRFGLKGETGRDIAGRAVQIMDGIVTAQVGKQAHEGVSATLTGDPYGGATQLTGLATTVGTARLATRYAPELYERHQFGSNLGARNRKADPRTYLQAEALGYEPSLTRRVMDEGLISYIRYPRLRQTKAETERAHRGSASAVKLRAIRDTIRKQYPQMFRKQYDSGIHLASVTIPAGQKANLRKQLQLKHVRGKGSGLATDATPGVKLREKKLLEQEIIPKELRSRTEELEKLGEQYRHSDADTRRLIKARMRTIKTQKTEDISSDPIKLRAEVQRLGEEEKADIIDKKRAKEIDKLRKEYLEKKSYIPADNEKGWELKKGIQKVIDQATEGWHPQQKVQIEEAIKEGKLSTIETKGGLKEAIFLKVDELAHQDRIETIKDNIDFEKKYGSEKNLKKEQAKLEKAEKEYEELKKVKETQEPLTTPLRDDGTVRDWDQSTFQLFPKKKALRFIEAVAERLETELKEPQSAYALKLKKGKGWAKVDEATIGTHIKRDLPFLNLEDVGEPFQKGNIMKIMKQEVTGVGQFGDKTVVMFKDDRGGNSFAIVRGIHTKDYEAKQKAKTKEEKDKYEAHTDVGWTLSVPKRFHEYLSTKFTGVKLSEGLYGKSEAHQFSDYLDKIDNPEKGVKGAKQALPKVQAGLIKPTKSRRISQMTGREIAYEIQKGTEKEPTIEADKQGTRTFFTKKEGDETPTEAVHIIEPNVMSDAVKDKPITFKRGEEISSRLVQALGQSQRRIVGQKPSTESAQAKMFLTQVEQTKTAIEKMRSNARGLRRQATYNKEDKELIKGLGVKTQPKPGQHLINKAKKLEKQADKIEEQLKQAIYLKKQEEGQIDIPSLSQPTRWRVKHELKRRKLLKDKARGELTLDYTPTKIQGQRLTIQRETTGTTTPTLRNKMENRLRAEGLTKPQTLRIINEATTNRPYNLSKTEANKIIQTIEKRANKKVNETILRRNKRLEQLEKSGEAEKYRYHKARSEIYKYLLGRSTKYAGGYPEYKGYAPYQEYTPYTKAPYGKYATYGQYQEYKPYGEYGEYIEYTGHTPYEGTTYTPTTETSIVTPPEKTTIITPPPTPERSTKANIEKDEHKKVRAWQPVFKYGGKTYSLGTYSTYNEAESEGMMYVDNTPTDNFEIIPVMADLWDIKQGRKTYNKSKFTKRKRSYRERNMFKADRQNEKSGNFNIFPYVFKEG